MDYLSHTTQAIVLVGVLSLIGIVVGALVWSSVRELRTSLHELAKELLGYEEIDIEEARRRHPSNRGYMEEPRG